VPKEYTYAEAGVDRKTRVESKTALKRLEQTFKFSKYGNVIQLPYGKIFPFGDKLLDLQVEGVGTKVLVAQLADKYDTIGIDGVALVVNDVIRSGAKPTALVDNIHTQVSDPELIEELMKGITKGAEESECIVPAGEIGDVAEIITGIANGKSFDLVVACVGELEKHKVIWGNNIGADDVIIGMESSGLHSNGITLARKVLFKKWGGKYDAFVIPDGFDRELVYEVLKPMKIYVKPLLSAAEKVRIKGAVHITGEGYAKFNHLNKFSKGIGFEFDNFKPQPIFNLIQQTAPGVRGAITDEEMLRTFNMGWGCAIIVNEKDATAAIDSIKKTGIKAEQIGKITDTGKNIAHYKNKKILLQQ
jgi:phosphoribosylformylglycinamidine cyclo-ligase